MKSKKSWLACAVVVALAAGGTPAFAAEGPLVTRPAVEMLGTYPGAGFAGTGVNTATGNFTRSWTDLPMPVGLLSWGRVYNSRGAADGPLGAGWTTALSTRVVEAADGTVALHTEDGRALTFVPDGTGGYTRPRDLDADLSRSTDGLFSLRSFAGNEKSTFDAGGLLAERSREGQRVTLARDDQGRLTSAAHSAGYNLALAYSDSGRLTTVTAGDGRTVTYGYSAAGVLTSVTAPDEAATRYESDNGRITRIEDAEGRLVVANTYDDGDDGRVLRQQYATGGTTFAYDLEAGTTTVTNTGTEARTTYRHNAAGRLVGTTDTAGNSTIQEFDDAGRLVAASSPGGSRVTLAYDGHGNVVRHEFGGAVTMLSHDTLDRVTSVTDPTGAVTRVGYTGDSLTPTEVIGPTGATYRASVTDGLVTDTTDPNGAKTTFGYDSGRRLTSVTDPLGHTTRYEYDQAGRPTATTTPLGRISRQQRDAAGRITADDTPSGARTEYRYSPAGLLLDTTDPTGAARSNQYDAAGRRVSSTDPLKRKTTYTYDGDGNVLTSTDPGGGTTRFTYDALGRRETVIHRTGAVTRYAYDADGRVTEVAEAAGTTVTGHDARGNVATTTDALGRVTRYEYDAANRLLSETDPTGATTRFEYDAAGRLIAVIDPTDATTRYEYDAAGHRTAVIDPLGHKTRYRYDAAGRLVATIDPLGGVLRHEYDADGRRITETTPAGLVTRFRYDADGQVTHITDPRGAVQRFEYSDRGEETASIKPDGAVHRLRYDAAGQLVATVDANGGQTRYAYDAAGNLTSLTDAKGARRTFDSNATGQERSFTDPLGRTTRRTYDDYGNVVSVTDPTGQTTRMEYNAARELTRRIGTDGSVVSYSYDGAGRRISMTDGTGTTRYEYDPAGRLLSATEPDGATVRMTYDAAGRQTSLRYPDGLMVSHRYDANSGLIGLDSRAGDARFTLNPDGLLMAEKLPQGWERRYEYSGNLLVHYQESHAGRYTRDTVLTRDSDGLITSQVDGGQVVEYRYDAADQLIAVRGEDGELLRAGYDEVGNRTSIARGGVETRLTYDAADQLVAADTGEHHVDYRYDPAGRLVEQSDGLQRRTIAYDGFGLPSVSALTKDQVTETRRATYDGDDLLVRLSTTVGDADARESLSTATRYRWSQTDEIPEILEQRQVSGHVTDADANTTSSCDTPSDADFVYGYDRILANNRCGAAVFAQDVFGSTIRTEQTGPWAQATGYDAFGAPIGGGHDPWAFDGGARSEQPTFGYRGELALGSSVYLRARIYDSTVGRFTAKDPISTQLGQTDVVSPYAYANNSPQDFVDPSGEIPIGIGGVLAALMPALLAALAAGSSGWDCPDPGNDIDTHIKCFQGVPFKTRGEYDGYEWALNGAVEPLSELWYNHKQEYAARAFVVNYLSNEKNSFWEELWDWDWNDSGVNPHVDWEVRLREGGFQRGPEGPNGGFIWADPMEIDLVVDERYIYEVKRWENGKNIATVEDQLNRYESAGRQWNVTWERGTELNDWADGWEAYHYTGFMELWGRESTDVIVWGGDTPGHVYFDEEKNVGDDERAKIKAKKKGGKGKMGGKGGKGGKGGRPPRIR